MSETSTQGSPSKSLGLNLSWTAFGELIFAGTSLLVLILLGKFGSAEVLGAYTYAMALVTTPHDVPFSYNHNNRRLQFA